MERIVNLEGRESKIYTVVLAAGSASRFGTSKQLARLHGQSLVQRAMQLSSDVAGRNTVLVVGAHWREVVDECKSFNPFIVRNESYENGMASSIACGVRAVESVADAVLIVLVDQPLVTASHLLSLRDAWLTSTASIVATEFANIAGAPAIFPAAFFGSLIGLQGDRGARLIIEENVDAVIKIPFAGAAVDIDTPEDLQGL